MVANVSEVAGNCPRCGARNFRFACERCSLLAPAAALAVAAVLRTVPAPITIEKVRAALERRGTFKPEDVESILRVIRTAQPTQGFSFPLWDRLRALWHRRRH